MPRLFVLAFVLVMPLSAFAQSEPTPAERAACQQDAFKFCKHAIPNRDRVRNCLIENIRRISPLCRGVLERTVPR